MVQKSGDARTTTSAKRSEDWLRSVRGAAVECLEPRPLDVLEGAIPPDLRGSYLRNGPGQLSVHGTPLKNLIDGAGFAQLVRFGAGGATLRARYIETHTRQQEEAAGKALFGGFSQLAPDRLKGHLQGRSLRYTANTNLIAHGGKLLALYENDKVYRVSPEDLSTEGHDDLGILGPGQRFGAHPKIGRDGALYNLGCEYTYTLGLRGVAPRTHVSLYRRTPDSVTHRLLSMPLPYPAALVHDMALTQRHALAIVSPLVLAPTVRVIMGLEPADRAVKWRPTLPSLLMVHDLASQKTQLHEFAAAMCFHMVNAFEDPAGGLCVDTCDFSGGDVVRITADMMQGRPVEHHEAALNRLHLSRSGEISKRSLSSTRLEWPRISPDYAGRPYRFVFGNTWDNHSPLPDIPVRIDLEQGITLRFPLKRPGEFAGEPLPVKKPSGMREQDVYVLCMVFDVESDSRTLHIWDGASPAAAALCRLGLPTSVPYGFHTNWVHDEIALGEWRTDGGQQHHEDTDPGGASPLHEERLPLQWPKCH